MVCAALLLLLCSGAWAAPLPAVLHGLIAQFNSLDTLHAAGFQSVFGATWNDPDNIRGFSRALAHSGGRGLLQTIWAGLNQNEGNLRHESAQFATLVLAADAAWSGGRS